MTELPSRNLPPKPPAPPAPPAPSIATSMTQRNSTQMLQNPRVGLPAGNAPPPPPVAGQRPVAPPPMAAPRATVPATSKPPAGLTLAQIVQEAFDQGYSDVHLGIGEIPRFRNRGEIQVTNYPETDKATFVNWLHEIMTDAEIQRFQDNLEFDGATQYEFARVRINVFDSLRGYAMVLRLIPLKILSIDQLRLPPIFRDICHYHKGLILVTGPTGSGKSTTMAAMVDYINREMPKHIITIEDPIEFVHQSRKSLVKQREVGMHTRKFDNALKAALREDPDLILVGEMRDKETVNTALKAAQTGHLVMGTLHTNSAVKTIERILNLYSGEEQDAMRVALSESLVAVIAQGLCRTTDGKRAAFHDILINTEAIKEWIKDAKYDDIGELMKQAGFDGMITMNQSLFNLYQEGRITEETAIEMSPTPNEMMQFLRGRV
ncbi:type IV pilus twitching motility protein PilT [Sphaerospermopsis sp. LEGE 08334]|uniref:type IV pilus twitching motility protein PilT n=1 Tax=Sphaerospermopsis sp. LEGE 08334 TaxID=1828651 RepID=UPI0018810357|nr:type IV pilus twitching motility protein PilT [Sphaerospermopsis sp. LEGE 08334]MBE9057736.1 type IV pilus twitching motility protein PilT [Sphaerospermopsis sp. LEGE 08334]